MLSYKNWKLYNESIGSTFVLGVKQPQNIGAIGATGASDITSEIEIALEEARKKMKKKMNGDMGEEPEPEESPEGEPEEKIKKRPPEDAAPEEGGGDEGDDEDEGDGDDGDGESPEREEPGVKEKPEPTLFQKKKQKSKMKKEDVEFWNSLQKMLHGGLPTERFRDGTNGFTEDALLAPIDINKAVTEVGPGEPGFAPQTRIGEV